MDLETLIAKQEITDVVYAYARGIDRLDFELVRSCYHPDAYDDHGAFKGNVDDFIEMCEGQKHTQWRTTAEKRPQTSKARTTYLGFDMSTVSRSEMVAGSLRTESSPLNGAELSQFRPTGPVVQLAYGEQETETM